MKKINFVSLDAVTLQWLRDISVSRHAEFAKSVEELLRGDVVSLMLELGNEETILYEEKITVGDLEIYPKRRAVLRDGIEIALTPKEFDILCFLAKNKGEVFIKEQIYQAVWEEGYYLADSNIMAFIRKLRKKIEPNPDAPEYILTIWGIGYKFNDRL